MLTSDDGSDGIGCSLGASGLVVNARLKRASLRTILLASYPVTSQASSPVGRRTRVTGCLALSRSNSGAGSPGSSDVKGNAYVLMRHSYR